MKMIPPDPFCVVPVETSNSSVSMIQIISTRAKEENNIKEIMLNKQKLYWFDLANTEWQPFSKISSIQIA